MLYSYFLIIIYYFLSVVFVFVSLVFFKYQCQNRYFQFNLQKKKIILMIDHIYIYIYIYIYILVQSILFLGTRLTIYIY
jgi:hypothetical protein